MFNLAIGFFLVWVLYTRWDNLPSWLRILNIGLAAANFGWATGTFLNGSLI